jgi:hypothetical protein
VEPLETGLGEAQSRRRGRASAPASARLSFIRPPRSNGPPSLPPNLRIVECWKPNIWLPSILYIPIMASIGENHSDQGWSEGQREFMKSLDSLGATKANRAVPIERAMPLSSKDLQALVDSGFVREAGANTYYLYAGQVRYNLAPQPHLRAFRKKRKPGQRLMTSIVFWIILILIPIILIQIIGAR